MKVGALVDDEVSERGFEIEHIPVIGGPQAALSA